MIKDNLEQVPRTYVKVYKHKTYTETGNEERRTYEGYWDTMVGKANAAAGQGGDAYNVTATVTRADGGLATCEIRKAEIEDPSKDEEEPSDSPGSEGNPGESRENPQYTLSINKAPEPLLTHARYASIPKDPREALRAMINGATRATELEIIGKDDKGNTVTRWPTVEEILDAANDAKADEARLKIAKGTDSYLAFETELQARYRIKNLDEFKYMDIAKIKNPGGPFPRPSGNQNWLFAGQSIEHSGKIIWITEHYLLSGKDGWDRDLYGA